eukprot:COSAG05_NODE_139_length_16772_cov_35.582559_4_plen_335_part_00
MEQGERELLEKQQAQLQELLGMLQAQQEAEAASAAAAAIDAGKANSPRGPDEHALPGSSLSRATAAAMSTAAYTPPHHREQNDGGVKHDRETETQEAHGGGVTRELAKQASQWMRENGISSLKEAQRVVSTPTAMVTLDEAVRRWISTSDLDIDQHVDMPASTLDGSTDDFDDDDYPGSTPRFSPGNAKSCNPQQRKTSAAATSGLPRLPADVGCEPTLAAIRRMSPGARKAVKDFKLLRPGYGTVCFNIAGHEHTDVNGIDLTNGGLVWAGISGTCTSVELFPEQPERKSPVGQVGRLPSPRPVLSHSFHFLWSVLPRLWSFRGGSISSEVSF